ncbi:MAG: thiamine phosphate synthase [Acidobacteriota bacterium]
MVYVVSSYTQLPMAWDEWIGALIESGVDCLQIREPGMTDGRVFELALKACRIAAGKMAVLVSRRADIARAAGAAGVHLPSRGLPAAEVRKTFGKEMWIGVSAHSRLELEGRQAADYALLAPIVLPLSKSSSRRALGMEALADAPLPVIALGGMTAATAKQAIAAGASGVAGVTLGLEVNRQIVRQIKGTDARPH